MTSQRFRGGEKILPKKDSSNIFMILNVTRFTTLWVDEWMGGFKIGFKNWLQQSKQSFSPIIVHPALDLFRLTQEKGIETASNKIQNFILNTIKKLGHFVDKFYWILNQKVLKYKDWSKVAGQ